MRVHHYGHTTTDLDLIDDTLTAAYTIMFEGGPFGFLLDVVGRCMPGYMVFNDDIPLTTYEYGEGGTTRQHERIGMDDEGRPIYASDITHKIEALNRCKHQLQQRETDLTVEIDAITRTLEAQSRTYRDEVQRTGRHNAMLKQKMSTQLRLKQIHMKQFTHVTNYILQLDVLMEAIRAQATNTEVLRALNDGSELLQSLQTSIEQFDVDTILDRMAEATEQTDALSSTLDPLNTDEAADLEAELAQLMAIGPSPAITSRPLSASPSPSPSPTIVSPSPSPSPSVGRSSRVPMTSV